MRGGGEGRREAMGERGWFFIVVIQHTCKGEGEGVGSDGGEEGWREMAL